MRQNPRSLKTSCMHYSAAASEVSVRGIYAAYARGRSRASHGARLHSYIHIIYIRAAHSIRISKVAVLVLVRVFNVQRFQLASIYYRVAQYSSSLVRASDMDRCIIASNVGELGDLSGLEMLSLDSASISSACGVESL